MSELFGRKTPPSPALLAEPLDSAISPAELQQGIAEAQAALCRLQGRFARVAFADAVGRRSDDPFTAESLRARMQILANELARWRRKLLDADPRAYALLCYGLPAVLESDAEGFDWDGWRFLAIPTLNANGAAQ